MNPVAVFLAAHIGAAAGISFFLKKLSQIYNKMGRFELLGRRLEGAAGKTPPSIRNSATSGDALRIRRLTAPG
jgi:hypothetical protein